MKMRNIRKLIEAMKKEIPKTEQGLINSLDDVLESSNYRAPEAYGVNFEQLAIALGNHLGDPEKLTEPWQFKIVDLFADKTKITGMDYIEV